MNEWIKVMIGGKNICLLILIQETPVSSRRTSSRVRAQPAYFDASPITTFTSPIKSQATPSSVSKSSSIKSTDRDDGRYVYVICLKIKQNYVKVFNI